MFHGTCKIREVGRFETKMVCTNWKNNFFNLRKQDIYYVGKFISMSENPTNEALNIGVSIVS